MTGIVFECIGFGVVGIDFMTATYIMAAGLRSAKRKYIYLFMLSFVFFSIAPASVLSVTVGEIAVNFINTLISENKALLRAFIESFILIALILFVCKRFFTGKSDKNKKAVNNDSVIKSIALGFIFAVAAYTDPSYYAVIILAGETANFFAAFFLISLWLLISQFAAFAVFFSISFNLFDKLTLCINKFKQKNFKKLSYCLHFLILIAVALMLADLSVFLLDGNFIFFK